MKTAEEKAEEYVDMEIPIAYTDETQTISLTELRQAAKIDYLAGYNEAMRWRDPKEELPEEGVDVFVKLIRSGEYGEEIIYTSSAVRNDFYHNNDADPFGCEGYYPAGNGGRVRVTVVGWRPIE